MQHLRLKGPYSCVSCEATAHPDEEVLSSFCDSQGGASSWGVAAAGAETSRTRGSSCGNREQESVKKLWPDFIELIHGYGCHSCAKTNFFFCHLGILCAHVCVDTGVPWFCAVLHPPPPRPALTHTHRSLQRSLHHLSLTCEVLRVPQPLRSNLRKHFLCSGLHDEHFTNMNLLSPNKILKSRCYYHPHFTDEDPETKRG